MKRINSDNVSRIRTMMVKSERRGRRRNVGLSYTMCIVVTESLSYETENEVLIVNGREH